MNRTLFALGSTAFLMFVTAAFQPIPKEKTETANPKIQMALLLDTSNSMDGMIDQAKSQLWKMVNELADSKKNGNSPDLEIALYQYGNSGLLANGGYLQQIVPLSTDLDEISDALFKLTTSGGSEYCPNTIVDAVEKLDWSPSDDDLKLIVISGNESFAQGPVTPEEACRAALSKGIYVTSIFCGKWEEGITLGWSDGAKCSEGEYLNIDTDEKVAHISTPYDDDIVALNTSLNKTYIGYGSKGQEKLQNQIVQESNAAFYGSANVRQRAFFKSKKQYNNAGWDLVDKYKEDNSIVFIIKDDELPAELKGKSEEEIEIYIEAKQKERTKIKTELKKLEEKAKIYEAKEKAKMAGSNDNTLDAAMQKAIANLATNKGYLLEK